VPPQLVVGLLLAAASWPAYWTVRGAASEDLFTPLWLGYILTVDGVCRWRTGSSPLTRRPWLILASFPASAGFWALHELFNMALHDWHYVAGARHSRFVWDTVQALTFSTVIPALWVTADLYRSVPALAGVRGGRLPRPGRAAALGLAALGAACLVLVVTLPRQTFWLMWLGPFLLLDPLNLLAGRPSLVGQAARGRWGGWVVLTVSALTCGFFWEMWNGGSAGYHWVYTVPYVGGMPHLFEMPLLGYLGYPPFAWSSSRWGSCAGPGSPGAGRHSATGGRRRPRRPPGHPPPIRANPRRARLRTPREARVRGPADLDGRLEWGAMRESASRAGGGTGSGAGRVGVARGGAAGPVGQDPSELLVLVARGDRDAFAALYDVVSGPVLGLVTGVLRDPAQSEEVTQEVLVEVWRTAARFRPDRGSAMTWVMTLAHRRAVDRVRSAQSAADREQRAALLDRVPAYDEVSEQVEARLEREQVRRCVGGLTELQREAVSLAYYRGLTYREVAELLALPLGTVKTRLRDGLIRLRDCLGVTV
jgi:RNA polymerase sigma-70 factor (ECF subfamily)